MQMYEHRRCQVFADVQSAQLLDALAQNDQKQRISKFRGANFVHHTHKNKGEFTHNIHRGSTSPSLNPKHPSTCRQMLCTHTRAHRTAENISSDSRPHLTGIHIWAEGMLKTDRGSAEIATRSSQPLNIY
jgi:hypothetical protein